jgi:diaminopropionate ammonia-lyase
MSPWKPARFDTRLVLNAAAAAPTAAYGPELAAVLSPEGFAEAEREITHWPGYQPTELVALPGLARAAGIGELWYKDESTRFGLGSFKALGGAYAVFRHLAGVIEKRTGKRPTSAEVMAGKHREVARGVTVCTATDGNHGRSVAWGARMFGCPCVIYIHATVSEGRKAAIEKFGAEVRRVAGNYDDSVHQAAADAEANGWQVISDTSYEGYKEIPKWVMQGYGVMVCEALDKLPAASLPTHLFIQAGVGGLPAALVAFLWQRLGAKRPFTVVVEPHAADCLYQTALAGRPTKASGDLETLMAGLAAGETSLLAWDILKPGANAFLTIPDDAAVSAMKALAEGIGGDRRVVGGEAGVGGLAGLLVAAADPELRRKLALDERSRVLVFGSEGDTDPVLYQRLVGRTAAEVRAA